MCGKRSAWSLLVFLVLLGGGSAVALDRSPAGPAVDVPYRLTIPKHLMVRARINGKGPFNFILDTGAPALFFTEAVAKKAGVKQGTNGWGVCDSFELEGGLLVAGAKARIDTPFQLEGMNGMGLAGAEIHGLIGYNILAQYRITIDLDSDRMVWRKLEWEPKAPFGLTATGGGSQGGLEMVGGMMKGLGGVLGRKATPTMAGRGFAGVFFTPGKDAVLAGVFSGTPADKAGLRAGDRITHLGDTAVTSQQNLLEGMALQQAGKSLLLKVQRDGVSREVTLLLEGGL